MPRERLLIFTRYPLAGKTKTRLIPAIGAESAADTQRELTELTLHRAISIAIARGVRIEVRHDGGDARLMRDWLGPLPRYAPQGEGELGQRLARAAQEAFDDAAESLVIIGADCPRLEAGILHRAFDALRASEVVFGPAQDGGYYLVGLRRPMPALFQGIPWSTDRVLAESLGVARARGHEPALLPTLPDVDEPADLPDWRILQSELRRISVIIPTLNEAAHLPETLRHVAAAKPHEIIVADGGSTDATLEIASQAAARIVRSERGRGAQMNAGARAASGELLFFLHADTLPPPRYDDAIRETLSSPQNIAGAFHFSLREPRPAGAAIIEKFTAWRNRWRSLPYGDQGIFIRRLAFEALGQFPKWPMLEDIEFIRRARRHGRVVIHPAAAQTSARRWQQHGAIRTFLRHQVILLGYYAGVWPSREERLP